MVAYLLAPVFAFIAAVFFFVPSEVMILVLANMDKVPLEVFGRTIDVAKYGTDFPWLLPFTAAVGSVAGSCIYYAMGTGTLRISDKLKKKIENFDFERLGRSRDAVVKALQKDGWAVKSRKGSHVNLVSPEKLHIV